jgi:hypothetical protein
MDGKNIKIMQKNIISILLVAVVMLFAGSCEDTRLDNIPSPRLLIPQSGVVEQAIYKTGEPFVFRLGVYKAGHESVQVPATATLSIKSQAELDVYNAENGTNFKRLPDNTFQASGLSMSFSQDSRLEFANITIDYNAVAALPDYDEDNTAEYVIPVELVQSSIDINEDRVLTFIKPIVRDPFIYFRSTESSVIIEPTATTPSRQELTLQVDFPNIWNISVDLTVDPALVDVFNQENGTNFHLLPADTYTMSPNPAVIANGRNTVAVTITIDGQKVDFDDFVLPVVIGNISRFEADPMRNVHFLRVSKPAPRLNRADWTIHDFSSEATNEGANNRVWAILNNENTFWHSSWSPPSTPPHHVTIDMQKEVLVTHVEIRRRHNNAGTRIGSFHVSADGVNFTKVGEFEMPASDTGNPFWLFRVARTRGRYLKIEVNSTHAMIAEVQVRGVDE